MDPKVQLMLDSVYADLKATDGTDISSRVKWQEYARLNNCTHMNDYTEFWKRAAKERDAVRHAEFDTEARRKDIVEAYRKIEGGYRPTRRDAPDDMPVVDRFIPR